MRASIIYRHPRIAVPLNLDTTVHPLLAQKVAINGALDVSQSYRLTDSGT